MYTRAAFLASSFIFRSLCSYFFASFVLLLDYVYFLSSLKSFWNKAQKTNNYTVMAKYNGADLGKLHIGFSLIIKKAFITGRPKTKVCYSEEHGIDVLSEIKYLDSIFT